MTTYFLAQCFRIGEKSEDIRVREQPADRVQHAFTAAPVQQPEMYDRRTHPSDNTHELRIGSLPVVAAPRFHKYFTTPKPLRRIAWLPSEMEQRMASFPVVRENVSDENWRWRILSACERLMALVLFAFSAPVVLASALVVWTLSGRAPFIAHRRVGWRGADLWMVKLRTMWTPDSPARAGRGWIEFVADDSGPTGKRLSDPRVPNGLARFLRRHSLDELPQLWHVVRGEMLLVGPRPITRSELREHYGEAAAEVLQVKPGMAGLWQVSGRNRLSYAERRAMDLEFVRNRSFEMYVRICRGVIREVWSGANAW
jgi:exopolysaccharide production protein ExoY